MIDFIYIYPDRVHKNDIINKFVIFYNNATIFSYLLYSIVLKMSSDCTTNKYSLPFL